MHLFLFIHIQLLNLCRMFLFTPFQQKADEESQCHTQQQEIKQFGRQTPIERRMNNYFQACFLLTPDTIVVSSFHLKSIGSGRQIGVSSLILRTYIIPFFIKTLQFIGILILFGRTIAQ